MAIHNKLSEAMPPLSHLECTVCHKTQDVSDVSDNLKNGWPTCHGYTMTLITQKQVQELTALKAKGGEQNARY